MARFYPVQKHPDANLPKRKTAKSAGYDFEVVEDTLIPAYHHKINNILETSGIKKYEVVDLPTLAEGVKNAKAKVTLVPTGIKCELDNDQYLELSVRSSCPLKHWLILGNGVGIIDADYFNNPDNEGEIFFQIINLSPYDVLLKKGDTIGQGIIRRYETVEDDCADGARVGGFGSTDR